MFTAINDDALIKLIRGARKRVIFVIQDIVHKHGLAG